MLASVAIASLLLAVPGMQGVTRQIAGLSAGWVAAAVALELGSCLAFVVIFRLFFDALSSGPARELALTEQGAGALLPGGGVGALAIGGWLLRREGLSMRHIVERSCALFFLTSATNIATLIGAGALLAAGLLAGPHDPLRTGLPVLGGLVVTAVVMTVGLPALPAADSPSSIMAARTSEASGAGLPAWSSSKTSLSRN